MDDFIGVLSDPLRPTDTDGKEVPSRDGQKVRPGPLRSGEIAREYGAAGGEKTVEAPEWI
jgi:hypothetical protein